VPVTQAELDVFEAWIGDLFDERFGTRQSEAYCAALGYELVETYVGPEWLRQHHHLVVVGPTGIGKSWLACALGHQACREGFSVLYKRASRLFGDLAQARGERSLAAADGHSSASAS
jgi:DNA replication protein DnaC